MAVITGGSGSSAPEGGFFMGLSQSRILASSVKAAGDQLIKNSANAGSASQLGGTQAAQLGSTAEADGNDPIVHVPQTNVPYFSFNTNTGDYIREDLDSSDVIASSFAVVYDFGTEGVQIYNGSESFICPGGKALTSSSHGLFLYQVKDASSVIYRLFGGDGTAQNLSTVGNSDPVPVGTRYVRGMYVVGGSTTIDYSDDGASWTTVKAFTTNTPAAGTHSASRLKLGQSPLSTSIPYEGIIAGISVEVDGSETQRVRVSDMPQTKSGSESSFSALGDDYTVTRATSGSSSVVKTETKIRTNGSTSYIQLDSDETPTVEADSGSFSLLIAARFYDTTGSKRVYSSESASINGLLLFVSSNKINAGFGNGGLTSISGATNLVLNELEVVGLTIDNGTLKVYRYGDGFSSGVDISSRTGAVHSAPRLGVAGYVVSVACPMELCEYMRLDNYAMTEAEMDAVALTMRGE